MTFVRETSVKATRKRHLCIACDKWIEPGEAAKNWAGMHEGDFNSVYYHLDCRVAEVALNDLMGWRGGDDWERLCDTDSENYAWLKAEHPLPYRRMLMSREQWAAIADQSPSGARPGTGLDAEGTRAAVREAQSPNPSFSASETP
jgi:hypothetical protein